MPDHKLEPGQLVLVRNDGFEVWRLRHFSHYKAEGFNFVVIGSSEAFNSYQFCIPYNDETKRLHNTKQPYVAVADAPHGDRQISATEISQEERDLWRFEASDECGTPSEEDERILRLLAALEAYEAGLERSCEETRANFSELYRMANEVVPELKRRAEKAEAERKKDLAHCKYEFERAEDAEAENTRLRGVLTAVEEIVLAAPELNMNNYDEDQVSTLNEAMIGVCGILLKEAARKAVANAGSGVEA